MSCIELDLPLLVPPGARQPSKKLAQVIIGDERAAPGLARHEVSVADCGVQGISAKAGQRGRFGDAVSAAAGVGNVLRHVCRPASGAVRVTAVDDFECGRRHAQFGNNSN
jgi:hypothetical protein